MRHSAIEASTLPPGADVGREFVGPYRLLGKLGEGGFGVVHEAEQAYPVKRRVALKLLKVGMDTREFVARFEAERQVLALMDHPHIAQVFAAGAAEDGRPYFAMELVRGESLVEYCTRHKLDLRARLDVCIQVCEAIQHAHTKGVIHRDLKPSNVLVSTLDDRPFAVVIDFGIAKAMSRTCDQSDYYTERGQLIGTPAYMSPEQVEGSLDIDTRADVYSLGVLMYELLTGSTPFSRETLQGVGYPEVRRIICETEPPSPSTRIAAGSDPVPWDADGRTSRTRVHRVLQGELDWIVMKAIDKDRQRRYESASAMAADLRRFLAGEAVLAAPPSASYRLEKLVRRHRGVVLGGALVALSLLCGLLAFAWQANEASRRASQLTKILEFQQAIFRRVDPAIAVQGLSRQLLLGAEAHLAGLPAEQRASKLREFEEIWWGAGPLDLTRNLIVETFLHPAREQQSLRFREEPLIEAALSSMLSDRYFTLGLVPESRALSQRALQLRREQLTDAHPLTLQAMGDHGGVLVAQGMVEEGERLERLALAGWLRIGQSDPSTLRAMAALGSTLLTRGKLEESAALIKQAERSAREMHGPLDALTFDLRVSLANLREQQGRADESERIYAELIEQVKAEPLRYDHDEVELRGMLAGTLMDLGKFEDAEQAYRQLIEQERRKYGNLHPETLVTLNNLGYLAHLHGRLDEAERYYRASLDGERRISGPDSVSADVALSNLGQLLRNMQRPQAAESILAELLARQEQRPESIDRYNTRNLLGRVYTDQGRLADAERLIRESLEGRTRLLGANHSDNLYSIIALARVLNLQGRHREVIEMLGGRLAAIRAAFRGGMSHELCKALTEFGRALDEDGRPDQAVLLLREAVGLYARHPGPSPPDRQASHDLLAALEGRITAPVPDPAR